MIEPEQAADHQAALRVVAAAFADHPGVGNLVELVGSAYDPAVRGGLVYPPAFAAI